MTFVFLIGRIVFGGYFLMNAYSHFFHVPGMAGYAASKGVPYPKAAIIGSGVLLLVAGLSMLFGVAPLVGISAIVLFLLPVTFAMHRFWDISDPAQRMSAKIEFMKNMAILGAALMLSALAIPWPLSL